MAIYGPCSEDLTHDPDAHLALQGTHPAVLGYRGCLPMDNRHLWWWLAG